MTLDPVAMLWQKIDEGKSQKELAEQMSISQGYLSDVLNRRKGVGDKVLNYLGVKVSYEHVSTSRSTAPSNSHDSKRNRARRARARTAANVK